MKYLFIPVIAILLISCNESSQIDTYQNRRNNIVNITKLIHKIDLGDIYVSDFAVPYDAGNNIVVCDLKSYDKPINVFDGDSYKHIVSFGEIGQGPKEITRLSNVTWFEKEKEMLVQDVGKMLLYAYNLDSVMVNSSYSPIEKYILNPAECPSEYFMMNDSVSYCRTMITTGVNAHNQSTGIWNMKTGDIDLLEYNHPDIHAKRFYLAVSFDDGIYAECNYKYDMISIFDIKGNLKKNIFGPQWGKTHLQCHSGATFTKDYLVTVYNGQEYEDCLPSRKCLVFSKSGDYIATLDIDYNILNMCYDTHNDRLVFTFNDDIQLGYLDLKEIKLK